MATAEATAPANNGTQLATRPTREVRVVEDHSATAYLFDTARFEQMQRIATAMASASLIPDHLRGKNATETLGNCFLVVNQAVRWGFDPFAVAPETYCVQGKLGFQGKLIAAVINARAGLSKRLSYKWQGSGDDRTIEVSGTINGEAEPRIVTLSVRQAKTKNAMWQNDPDQKLVYSGATKWARRHCPEVMLGVLTDDDLERMAEQQYQRTLTAEGRPAKQSLESLTEKFSEAPYVPPVTEEASQETDEANQGDAPDDVDQRTDEERSEEIRLTPDHPLYELQAMLDVANSVGDVTKAENSYLGPDSDPQLHSIVRRMAEARREQVRGNRGSRSNK